MSQFGHGTFKQNLLDYIIEEKRSSNLDIAETIQECLSVVSHLASLLLKKDKVNLDIYQKAKKQARDEILEQIRIVSHIP